ncbi:NAD(P)-binding protein [Hortaea werneckii]|nr:NAD(P)-binding protein [Hortaea werneckii]KAI6878661.1 NAD(P)-binding protein [Hortaea werneckii]KAI6986640.1 NAD(P)-binding protein [Hortaea werneckii]KAI7140805.1 NAD(P)-binding protein [Hortaea werneckii]KAI7167805.1 NAD(P)-binding protein [Hortaea werneckii]
MALQDVNFAASSALVTGGSSGIGRAIAEELIARGVRRMILVAKTGDKLASVSEEMRASTPDLTLQTIQADLKNFESDPSLATIDVMVRAVVELSLRFLPDMVKQGKGGILNVGSTACYQPVPYTSMYAASKAFILSWSQAIREEQRHNKTGVRIAQVVPGVTETNLDGKGHGERRGPIELVGVDQPSDVAKVAVDAYEENAAAKVVGWNNTAFHTVMNTLPDSAKAMLVSASRGKPTEDDKM